MSGWDFVHNFVCGWDSLEAPDQSSSLEPVRILREMLGYRGTWKWRDQSGSYCWAEGNECLNLGDSNREGKKRGDMKNVQIWDLQCPATNWMQEVRVREESKMPRWLGGTIDRLRIEQKALVFNGENGEFGPGNIELVV